jgi:hypothetical protein
MTVASYPIESEWMPTLRGHRRIRGMVTAMWVAAPVSVIMAILTPFMTGWLWLAVVVQVTAALMGALFAGWSRVRAPGRRPRVVVLVMSIVTVFVGDVMVSALLVPAFLTAGEGQPAWQIAYNLAFMSGLGLLVLGLPILGIVLLHAWAWVGLMRR